MKDFNLLGKIFLFWQDIGKKYEAIKQDPEKAEKDVSLGVTSLSMSIMGAVTAIAFAYFTFKCFTLIALSTSATGTGRFFALIGGIICAVVTLATFVYLILAGIVYANYQRKLNKKIIGKIALIVSVLLSVGTLVAVIVFATQLFLALK